MRFESAVGRIPAGGDHATMTAVEGRGGREI